jgi:hypothetical protein
LTEDQVSNIKGLLLHPYGGLMSELAHRYGVDTTTIRDIGSGTNWAWVQPSPTPVMPPFWPSDLPPMRRLAS